MSQATLLPYSPSAVAEALLGVLDQAAAGRGSACLAIPGGRSPGAVLSALAGMVDAFLRPRLHLVWLDERAVAVGHPDRNDLPTLAAWREGGALPGHVHPMPAESDDLHAAATAYAALLADVTGGLGPDAALVGMGEDGHCASLFPRHPGLKEVAEVFPVFDSPKPPPRRLTVSLAVLHRCRLLTVLALGEAKGGIVRQVIDGGPTPALPVSLLPHAATVWYLDDAAMERCRQPA